MWMKSDSYPLYVWMKSDLHSRWPANILGNPVSSSHLVRNFWILVFPKCYIWFPTCSQCTSNFACDVPNVLLKLFPLTSHFTPNPKLPKASTLVSDTCKPKGKSTILQFLKCSKFDHKFFVMGRFKNPSPKIKYEIFGCTNTQISSSSMWFLKSFPCFIPYPLSTIIPL